MEDNENKKMELKERSDELANTSESFAKSIQEIKWEIYKISNIKYYYDYPSIEHYSACSICGENFDDEIHTRCCLKTCGHCLCDTCAKYSTNSACTVCRTSYLPSDIFKIYI